MNVFENYNELLNQFLENKEGYTLEEVMENTGEVQNVWYQFILLLKKNVPYFSKYNFVLNMKICQMHTKPFFILQLGVSEYLIIDIEKNRVLKKENAIEIFDKDFFRMNFNEKRTKYTFFVPCKNPKELVDFYLQYESILSKPFLYCYFVQQKDTSAYLEINLAKSICTLGIEDKKRFLYDQYVFNKNFYLLNYADALNRMNKSKVKELSNLVKTIKVPYSSLPKELLEESYTRELTKN